MIGNKPRVILEPRKKFNYSSDPKIFYDLIIVGAGVAGLASAMYAGRLGMKVLVVGELSGGTITLTKSVENYPGFISIEGGELGRLMENHAKDYDIDVLSAKVDRIEIHRKKERKHFLIFSGKDKYFSKTLIVATGTEVRKLNVPGEKELNGKGVSYCALCDGPLFKDKIVGVVGGGNSAVKEALLLSEYAKKVYVFYRRDTIRVEKENMARLNEKVGKGKIVTVGNTNIVEIKGDSMIKSVTLDRAYEGNNEFELGGLFVYIGHLPRNKLVKDLEVKLNKGGEIIINANSGTNIRGFYAAGDVTNSKWKQAVIGVAEGVKAAFYAYEYVEAGDGVLPLIKAKLLEVKKNV